MSKAQFFMSQRGRPKLAFQGYIYQCQREMGHYTTWRCEAREKHVKCTGKAKSCHDQVEILVPHNHPPDYPRVQSEILKRTIIENAAAQGLSGSSDINGIVSSIPDSIAAKMPTLDCMKRAIRRRQHTMMSGGGGGGSADPNNRSGSVTAIQKQLNGPPLPPLPTTTMLQNNNGNGNNGNDYYSNILLPESNSMDIFSSNNSSGNNHYDAKQQLQSSIFDPNPATCSYTTINLEPPQSPMSTSSNNNEEDQEPIGSSNNGFMEFICHLQGEVNDLKTENAELKSQLKKADERLNEIERRLKINKKELPADARFEIARLTLSKIGTFQFYGGSKTVDVASFLRQVSPEERSVNPKLPRILFTECIKMILGDSIVYYTYKKHPKEGCFQLDSNLFNCILGLICDGYGLNKDPQKDNEKDKYLRECIVEELNITARRIFKESAADAQKAKDLPQPPATMSVASNEPTPVPSLPTDTGGGVKRETSETPVVYIESDDDSDY